MLQMQQFDRSRFNSLPEIERADAEARESNELSAALHSLGPIFVKHGVHESWGLSLLHKHWDVGVDELPIQDVTKSETPMEFESKSRASSFGKPFFPSVLAIKIQQEKLEPLEFSADPSVSEANNVLASASAFLEEVASTATENNLEGRFGLIALRDAASGYDLVEFNFVEPLSLVRETKPEEILGQRVIETSWRFAPDAVGGTCTRSCFSRCTTPSGGGGHRHDHTPAHRPG